MLRIDHIAHEHDRALALNGSQIRIIDAHGAHAPARLLAGSYGESAISDVDPGKCTERTRLGRIGANGKRAMHEHIVKQPAHTVGQQRLNVLARRKAPCLALHVGQGAHEQGCTP